MKRLMPRGTDCAIFATMAVLCAGIVGASPTLDLTVSLLSIPIFITAAMMGMYRTGQLAADRETRPLRDEAPADEKA